MSVCAQCAMPVVAGELCPIHIIAHDDWATQNRIACDFVHRGVEPPNVTKDAWTWDQWIGMMG